MPAKRIFTDEEIKFILSSGGTLKDIISEFHSRWPERDVSEVNIKGARSTYLVDDQGNVKSKRIHTTNLMREQLEQNPELLASKVKAAREAEQRDAAIQKAEKRDFDLFQSSREIRSALGMQRWGSSVKPPIAKISALMNQARKQGLIKPLDSSLTSSSNQGKICSDRDIRTPKKSAAYSTDTEAVETSSSMEIGMVSSAGLTTVQDSLGFAPTTPIPQQIVSPIQTTTPNPDPTSFYEYLLYILMFSKPC
jgi:hypothetical protein